MKRKTQSERQTIALGEEIAKKLCLPVVVELIGDVGAGKTTLAKGIAKGLGITENIQSPSFTIFARYDDAKKCSLHHYDFYRLSEPGVTMFDLAESIAESGVVTVVEWANTVADILPKSRVVVHITPRAKNGRQIDISGLKI